MHHLRPVPDCLAMRDSQQVLRIPQQLCWNPSSLYKDDIRTFFLKVMVEPGPYEIDVEHRCSSRCGLEVRNYRGKFAEELYMAIRIN